MLILGDEEHSRGRIPFVTFFLLGVTLFAFAAQVRFDDALSVGWALVPREITEFRDLTKAEPFNVHLPRAVRDGRGRVKFHDAVERHTVKHYPGPFPIALTLVTYQFLHGDIIHLAFNLWFLFIFARNVECSLGPWRFTLFYLGCGVVAGLAQVGADPKSVIPIVGASGAIAGVMGAYLAIFPFNKIRVWVGGTMGMALGGIVELPAIMVIGFWFLGQYLAGMAELEGSVAGGTAYWCHIGGFLVGFGSIKAIVWYLRSQIAAIEEEEGIEEKPRFAGDPLEAPEVPTAQELDNILDPVAAFQKYRETVFPDRKPLPKPVLPGAANARGTSDAIAEGQPE